MNILITGGFGYLGGRLAQFLVSQTDYKVYLGSREQRECPAWLPRANIVQIVWSSQDGLTQICKDIDAVVHLAGMNSQDCAADPVAAIECNAVSTARLLQACIRQNVKRFVYISTAHVYSSSLIGNINEETCSVALHPYATSHRAGEDVVLAAHHRREIEGVVIRLSNAYGAPAHKDANCWMLLVNDLCKQAVISNRLVLESSGGQRRDFVSISDACLSIRHLLKLPVQSLGNGLFNVGGNWAPTILEMAEYIAELFYLETGKKPEITRNLACETERDNLIYLNYGMKKIIDTGFQLSDKSNIDKEISGLIQFCLRYHSA